MTWLSLIIVFGPLLLLSVLPDPRPAPVKTRHVARKGVYRVRRT